MNKREHKQPLCFAVLGHPIAHSRSPQMHAANFAALGLRATYEARDVTETQLAGVLDTLQQDGFTGVNLTIPLKARALQLVNAPTPLAQLLGGVNTLHFREGGLRVGDNTDGFGFLAALDEAGLTGVTGLRVLVLGCGGTGRALALTCAQAGASAIMLANRTLSRAQDVATRLKATDFKLSVETLPADHQAWTKAARHCDLIVHTTSQGLDTHDAPLLTREAFRPKQFLFDAVYSAEKTPILKEAEAAGACGVNGLGMLVHQGAQSFRIWTGREPNLDAMRRACIF